MFHMFWNISIFCEQNKNNQFRAPALSQKQSSVEKNVCARKGAEQVWVSFAKWWCVDGTSTGYFWKLWCVDGTGTGYFWKWWCVEGTGTGYFWKWWCVDGTVTDWHKIRTTGTESVPVYALRGMMDQKIHVGNFFKYRFQIFIEASPFFNES